MYKYVSAEINYMFYRIRNKKICNRCKISQAFFSLIYYEFQIYKQHKQFYCYSLCFFQLTTLRIDYLNDSRINSDFLSFLYNLVLYNTF